MTNMPPLLIVTASNQISITRCILLAVNFLSNIPDAEIYLCSESRMKDLRRHQRLSSDEKLAASRFSLWSDECCARASSSQVFVVADPFEARIDGPHEKLFSSLKSVKDVYLVSTSIDFFKKNARSSDQARFIHF